PAQDEYGAAVPQCVHCRRPAAVGRGRTAAPHAAHSDGVLMTREMSLAVVGATGLVGETLLEQLAESGLAMGTVHAVASSESAGKRIEFGDRLLKVSALDDFDFSSVELALFAVPPAV